MNEFVTAVRKALESGTFNDIIIFKFIDNELERYGKFNRIGLREEIVQRRYTEIEDQFFTAKMLDGGGFKYLASRCNDDYEASKTMQFLIRQFNDDLFFKDNPHLMILKRDIKDLLRSDIKGIHYPQLAKSVIVSPDFSTDNLDALSAKAQWIDKKNRLEKIIRALKMLLIPGKVIRFQDLIREVIKMTGSYENKVEFESSQSETDPVKDSGGVSKLETAAVKNMSEFPEIQTDSPSVEADAEMHASQFVHSLTPKERLLLSAGLLQELPDDKDPTFNEMIEKLEKITQRKSSVLYDYRKKLMMKKAEYIKRESLSEEEQKMFYQKIISLLKGKG